MLPFNSGVCPGVSMQFHHTASSGRFCGPATRNFRCRSFITDGGDRHRKFRVINTGRGLPAPKGSSASSSRACANVTPYHRLTAMSSTTLRPLWPSAFSALNRFFNEESTEVRKRAQRRHCSLYRFNLSGEVLRTLSQQDAGKMQSNKLISVGTNVARLLLSLILISKLKGRESLCQRMEASTKQQPAPPQAQEQQAPAREQRFRKPRRTTVKKFLTSQARQKIT